MVMRIGRGREIGHHGRSLHEGGTEMERGNGSIGLGDLGAGREPLLEGAITTGGSGREIAGGGMKAQGEDDFFYAIASF